MRFLVSLRFLPVAISLLGYPSRALAQSTASILAEVPKQDLAQFEGTYHYREGLTLFMVSNGSQLYALIENSKYTLRSSGSDAFLNPKVRLLRKVLAFNALTTLNALTTIESLGGNPSPRYQHR